MPRLLVVSGSSGVVAALGVTLASASILATLRRSFRPAAKPLEPVAIGPDANVAALVETHPEALPLLVEAGFGPLANPIARRTIARAVSLRTACQLHHIDVDALVARLRAACSHGPLVPVARLSRRIEKHA
jgi:hypothetical protein